MDCIWTACYTKAGSECKPSVTLVNARMTHTHTVVSIQTLLSGLLNSPGALHGFSCLFLPMQCCPWLIHMHTYTHGDKYIHTYTTIPHACLVDVWTTQTQGWVAYRAVAVAVCSSAARWACSTRACAFCTCSASACTASCSLRSAHIAASACSVRFTASASAICTSCGQRPRPVC